MEHGVKEMLEEGMVVREFCGTWESGDRPVVSAIFCGAITARYRRIQRGCEPSWKDREYRV